MKFINKKLSSKSNYKILNIFCLMIILIICPLFLPTLSVEGKSNDLENKVVYETTLKKFENKVSGDIHLYKVNNLNKNITINMKEVKGNAQTLKWTDEVLDRVNVIIDNCKGKFSSLDMILMPLNLNSNQWINH